MDRMPARKWPEIRGHPHVGEPATCGLLRAKSTSPPEYPHERAAEVQILKYDTRPPECGAWLRAKTLDFSCRSPSVRRQTGSNRHARASVAGARMNGKKGPLFFFFFFCRPDVYAGGASRIIPLYYKKSAHHQAMPRAPHQYQSSTLAFQPTASPRNILQNRCCAVFEASG